MGPDRAVLFVEDDAAVREAVTFVLGVEGYRVAAVANGRDALAYLRTHEPPCVILLDLRTPVMDGWEFRRLQQEDPALADLPVIVVSGAADVKAEARALGAAGYIQKPIEVGALVGTVRLFVCAVRPEVLLVTDRPPAQAMVTNALQHQGINVRLAHNQAEAVEVYGAHRDAVALALIDAAAGAAEAVAAALRQQNPQLRVCFLNRPDAAPGDVSPLAEAAQYLRQLARPA